MGDTSPFQYGRKATLLVTRAGRAGNNPSAYVAPSTIDLSNMHFRFRTAQQDLESPNNCNIRVWNLSEATVNAITKYEYDRVILQAGYDNTGHGVIFDGNIKQFRLGRENGTDTYLDILAADGDLAYNFSLINETIAAKSTPAQRHATLIKKFNEKGVKKGHVMEFTGGVLPRGKVLFGMARVYMRQLAESQGATWGIDNGEINVIPLDGFKPGEALVLTAQTGLIGLPEQTNNGIEAKSLLNPRIEVSSLVRIDNRSVNQLLQQNGSILPAPAFNKFKEVQNLAHVAADGLYRVYVVEHEGDTRGQAWYSHLTCLAVNPITKMVRPYG